MAFTRNTELDFFHGQNKGKRIFLFTFANDNYHTLLNGHLRLYINTIDKCRDRVRY